MAFVKARIEIKPASVGTGIKATLRRTKKAAATLSLFVSATRALAFNIGDGDGVEVLIGDGEHHGLIRLRKNNSAGVAKAEKRATGKADFFVLKLGHQAAFVDRSEAAAWCQWEMVEDGWVEIALPKWADDTAPNRKPPVARAPVSAVPVVKQSVTAGLMGDPPPGRRQMLEEAAKIVGKIAAGKK
jgi:hypothetical protein